MLASCDGLFGSNSPHAQSGGGSQSALISQENAHPGSTSWRIPTGKAASTQIQAYADALSVLPGQMLTFYVSVQQAGTAYTIHLYRLGWYGGAGARLMQTTLLVGQAQGYYDSKARRLVNCNTCSFDPKTRLVEARWQPSFKLRVPNAWITGVYLATFTDAAGEETYVTFDVRGNLHSTYVAVTSDTTYAAYNSWGGYSLYLGPDGTDATRASQVSLDRPAAGASGAQGLPYEIDTIRWMERQGYDLSYISSVDLDRAPEQLLNHRAVLDLGHDEYWSEAMRTGLANALHAGVGLGFIGGNDGYWQIRFEQDSVGTPDRTIICYKEAKTDPYYGIDNSLVTVQWRDTLLGHPENAIMGVMWSDFANQPTGFPWQVDAHVSSSLLAGTGLQPGKAYGCDLVGYEWDRVFTNGASPSGLQVLSTSATLAADGKHDFSNTTAYMAQSGALVFAAGSIYWSYALDSLRLLQPASRCANETAAIPEMQKLLANVMAALAVRHSTSTPAVTPTR
jgi:hypothetical protein